ncbi:unnamed protein product [Didymodactylos carnosus]|uniref:EF-hand domain-containing protein n=1 Tax=Didymodactylos carnosus TaxID=1234261 RepID=A0A8S2DW25_9BILA|nr:unnamed protein product [Didymodactylos carnosus]CAF3832493.1 unnamed protein product [Didymodactylos carnosus]
MADALFQQADTNRDNRLDLNEFRNLVSSTGIGGRSFESSNYSSGGYSDASLAGLVGADGGYNSYSSGSGYDTGTVGLGGAVGLSGVEAGGYGSSSFESSNYSSGTGLDVSGWGAGAGGAYGAADLSAVSGGVDGLLQGANYSTGSTSVQQYATDAQGLFQDSNPQIIRKPAPGGDVTYKQNILVRFLQPPPPPPRIALYITEVRPPQPPAPPPLVVRQRPPVPPQPSPLFLRERPPPTPASVAAQTVIRNLAAMPTPPRSVVIERVAAPPPKPRDIIVERWLPYGPQAQRKTIVQRAAAAQQYKAPRNIIIQYEPIQAHVVRQFQRLGVQQENPQTYVQRYGAVLLDSATLLQHARAAGVIEDLVTGATVAFSGASYSAESTGATGLTTSEFGGEFSSAGGAGFNSSSYESSSTYGTGSADFGGLETSGAGGVDVTSGLVGGYDTSGLSGSASYSSSSYGTGAGGVHAAFQSADTNRDGTLSRDEFRNFVGNNL